ncbi:hypothetical protein ACH4PU_30655 [Streptomyces sp. NPDC021100]|uniref:hypothetical protein n=1 Tax=Streptomyces sp. NPDC021100 TaxID=3365114 RepID=UPI0037B17275
MARYAATIKAVHADGTECTHKRTSTGKATTAECTGRDGYTARCSGNGCTWTSRNTQKTVLETQRAQHLRTHLNPPAPNRPA